MEFTLMPARTSWRDWDSRCTAWLIAGCSVAKARDRSMIDTNKTWRKLIRSIMLAVNFSIDGLQIVVEMEEGDCFSPDAGCEAGIWLGRSKEEGRAV